MADQVSEWLAKLEKATPEQLAALGLSPEHVAAAKKEHLLERDYTQKTQKVAALQKIADAYPDLRPDQVIEVYNWYRENNGTVKEALDLWNRRGEFVERPKAPVEGTKRKWREYEGGDLYDRAVGLGIFEDLHADAVETATKRIRDEWYQKDELPRLNGVVDSVTGTVLDLMEAWGEDLAASVKDPKHARMSPFEMLKRGAASGMKPGPDGRMDFRKLANDWRQEQAALTKPIEEEAYRKGLEEGRRAADGPSGPAGVPMPRRPEVPETRPKTREATFDLVRKTVEAKHGPIPV